MSDDIFDLLNSLNSTTVTEESDSLQSTQQNNNYSSTSGYDSYNSLNQGVYDDYSMTPNYTEEQTYNSAHNSVASEDYEEESVRVRTPFKIDAPVIRKDETPVVNLVKTKQKIQLQARMKIVVAMFSVIVSLLLFVSVYNFAYANKLKSSFADKQMEISMLQADITRLVNEYNDLGNNVKSEAEANDYVEVTDENTMSIKLGEYHHEQVVQSDLPSGWFDKVCDFLSGIFN